MYPLHGLLTSKLACGPRRVAARRCGDGDLGRFCGDHHFSTAFALTAQLAVSGHASVGSAASRLRSHVPRACATRTTARQ